MKYTQSNNASNLIYIVYDRGFRLATYDFKEAIIEAFDDGSLVVFDLENKDTLLDFYCTEDTLYELEAELIEEDLFNIIPNCKEVFNDLRKSYENIWHKRREQNKKMEEKHEYEIYLKVKERLELK